jgi:molecular chaperone GrpE
MMQKKQKAGMHDLEKETSGYQAEADGGKAHGAATPLEAPAHPTSSQMDQGNVVDKAETSAEALVAEEPSLEAQLEAKTREAHENYDRLLRISADFDNFKKRSARELDDFRKYANEALLRELLPVVDNLERALDVPVEGDADGALRQGIELTLKEVLKVLERFAVRPIDASGKPFNPAFHEAMMQEETDLFPDNTVMREFQKGYTIHDRLLRPAMVIVAKAAARGQVAPPAGDTTEAQS